MRIALSLGEVSRHLLVFRNEDTVVLTHDGTTHINLLFLLGQLACSLKLSLGNWVSLALVLVNIVLVVVLLREEQVLHRDSKVLSLSLVKGHLVILPLRDIFESQLSQVGFNLGQTFQCAAPLVDDLPANGEEQFDFVHVESDQAILEFFRGLNLRNNVSLKHTWIVGLQL